MIDAVTLAEKKRKPVSWMLDGVMPAGGLVLVAGETSAGKSLLGLELAIGTASSGTAWGLKCGVKGRVGYFCADADEGEMGRRVWGLCAGLGVGAPENLQFEFRRHVFEEDNAPALEKMIRQEDFKLVVLDPLNRYLMWMNDNSPRVVGESLQTMREVARATGVTVVIIQAFNKLPKRALGRLGETLTDGTERVRGSTELVAACDAVFLVTRGKTKNLVELVKNRQSRTAWASYFSLVDHRDDEAEKLMLVFEAVKEGEVKAPATLAELLERRMKRVMRGKPEKAFGREELRTEVGKLVRSTSKRAWAEAFGLLGKDREVKVETERYNRKFYRLAEPEQAFYQMVAEEEGQMKALDLLGRKLAAEAPLRLLEKQLNEITRKNKEGGALEEVMRKARLNE